MALIICRKCGKEYSTRHVSCTQCGQPTAKQSKLTIAPSTRDWKAPALFIILTFTALLWLITRPTTTVPAPAVNAGVEGRSKEQICDSTTIKCKHWTELAKGCAENLRRREAGFLGKFPRNYCSEAETYREQVTGIADSNAKGAYSF